MSSYPASRDATHSKLPTNIVGKIVFGNLKRNILLLLKNGELSHFISPEQLAVESNISLDAEPRYEQRGFFGVTIWTLLGSNPILSVTKNIFIRKFGLNSHPLA